MIRSRSALQTGLFAWLVAGTMDISAAIIYYAHAQGPQTKRLLQGIASGLLGASAFTGGLRTALLGMALHYTIALIWTLVFFVGTRAVKRPLRQPVVVGLVYGAVVWCVMNLIVLPLSNVRHGPIHLQPSIIGAVILMFCIGLPIALIVGTARD